MDDVDSRDDVQELRETLSRYKKKQNVLELILEIYRRGILALYADGSWYNSVHFNAFMECAASNGARWIEKEVAVVKACLLVDNQTLERFCHNLHLQVRQLESYSSELRSRLEETLKEMYTHR
jgi:hypothetical protein